MQANTESVKRVVPMVELLYFDPGQFGLYEYADAIIETFSIGLTGG
jgi:hypothetical protein